MYADCQTVSTATSFVLLLETFTIMLPQQESMTRTSFQEDGRNFRVAYYCAQQVKLLTQCTKIPNPYLGKNGQQRSNSSATNEPVKNVSKTRFSQKIFITTRHEIPSCILGYKLCIFCV